MYFIIRRKLKVGRVMIRDHFKVLEFSHEATMKRYHYFGVGLCAVRSDEYPAVSFVAC